MKASMSRCQMSRYTATAPLRWPSWSTDTAVLLSCLIHGTTPPDELGTPRIGAPLLRTYPRYAPTPPPCLDTRAISVLES
ncbi:hypothetical protein D3C73_1138330 [compost metagenome]